MTDRTASYIAESSGLIDALEHFETTHALVRSTHGVCVDDAKGINSVIKRSGLGLEEFDTLIYTKGRSTVNLTSALESLSEATDKATSKWVDQAVDFVKYSIQYISRVAPKHDDATYLAQITRINDYTLRVREVNRKLVRKYGNTPIGRQLRALDRRMYEDGKLPHNVVVQDHFTVTGSDQQYQRVKQWSDTFCSTTSYLTAAVRKLFDDPSCTEVPNDTGLKLLTAAMTEYKNSIIELTGNKFKVDFVNFINKSLEDVIDFDRKHPALFNPCLAALQKLSDSLGQLKTVKRKEMTTERANATSTTVRMLNKAILQLTDMLNALVEVFRVRYNQRLSTLQYALFALDAYVRETYAIKPEAKRELLAASKPLVDDVKALLDEIKK